MINLQDQISRMYQNADPDVREVVAAVITAEQELIHLDRARGINDRIDEVLDRVAKRSLKGTPSV